ncbi:site-specific integrase [Lysobacter olei]
MAPRPRKHNSTIPPHIDQKAIPKGVYWDASGNGRWYMLNPPGSVKRRIPLGGRGLKLSDLHSLAEGNKPRGTVQWLCEQYHASPDFAQLAKLTKADYEYSRDVALNLPTATGGTFGRLDPARLRPPHIHRIVDRLRAEGTPTKANKVLRYLRLVFGWGIARGHVTENPAKGVKQAKERQRQRLPTTDAYTRLLTFARDRGARTARTAGSVAPYLWLVMELGYLCRLRGIETITLTEANAEADGILTNRRKRSRDSLVEWTPRLKAVWDAALALRRQTRGAAPELIRPEDRVIFLASGGEPLSKSGLDTAWQRLVKLAMREGILTAEERFSLHDLKRKGGTDAVGDKGQRQDALGVSDAMMKVYDKSVPRVKPSGFTE